MAEPEQIVAAALGDGEEGQTPGSKRPADEGAANAGDSDERANKKAAVEDAAEEPNGDGKDATSGADGDAAPADADAENKPEGDAQQGADGAAATTGPPEDVSITVRSLVAGKDIGSLIGKQGAIIKLIRESSGAKVNISDSSGGDSDRIVTVAGSAAAVFRAHTYMAQKIVEASGDLTTSTRLCIPHAQAGSVIGAGGQTIQSIRQATGAEITVEKDMLPGSNERLCTINGTAEAVGQAVYHVTCALIAAPPGPSLVPYKPEGVGAPAPAAAPNPYQAQAYPQYGMGGAYGQYQQRPMGGPQQTHQLVIANDMAGAVIGRGGSKINEIRQVSQATVRMSDPLPGGTRTITIQGTAEAVQMATYLVQTKLQEGGGSLAQPQVAMTPAAMGMAAMAAAASMPGYQ
eukprot:m.483899 g.483899  ORF g.483899 m.483899 type:complete len:404 (+) comp23114_c0_seq1:216-1427(+)